MIVLIWVFATVLGVCVGSFCNVLIVRLHEGSSVGGRSRCVACRKPLKATHLIPLVSWIILRARCVFCRAPIHWQYPTVETAGGIIGLVSLLAATGSTGAVQWTEAVTTAIFLFALLIATAVDLRWQVVPTGFMYGSAIVLGLWRVALNPMEVPSMIVGAAVAWTILFVFVWLSRGRMMGEGDPAVGALIGATLGWPLGVVALALAFMIGGAVAAVLLLVGAVRRKTAVPFVPFLTAGAIVAYFWSERLTAFIQYALI